MKISLSSKSFLSPANALALVVLLLFVFFHSSLQAQSDNYHIGVRGGIGMSTLNGYKNNGLKLGVTAGLYGQYQIKERHHVSVELFYSTGGQQAEKWKVSGEEQIKEYSKYTLHYINIPLLYQYYFPEILGLEAGLNFRYCLSGSLKTKIGNGSWQSENFSSSYNSFDMGLMLGIYTENLIPHDNFFVSLRAYFGFIDVVKEVGSNKNLSVTVSVGYMLF